jgi:hypothetical protein
MIPGAIVLVIDSVEVGEDPFLTIKAVRAITLSVYSLEVGMAIVVCRGGGLESDMASVEQ